MSDLARDFDAEEKKVLTEALSKSEVQVGPSAEYVAELRCRLLSATTPGQLVKPKSNRRMLLGSIVGACAAAILFAAIWFLNAEPAWASAIRRAREQAWIHSKIERDGVRIGEIWVSPERDIVAGKFASAVLFFDYKQGKFLRYDVGKNRLYLARQPDSQEARREQASVSQLAEMFRRSPGADSLFHGQRIEHWDLHTAMIGGIPCDEYEIVTRPLDRPPTTLLLTVDKRRSLPISLARAEGESHTTISRFEYPTLGPLDAQSPLLGIPPGTRSIDVDESGEVSELVQSLKQGRRDFDDYTAFSVAPWSSVASRSAFPFSQCDVRRTLRSGNKWRIDAVSLSTAGRDFAVARDQDQGLSALRSNKANLKFDPIAICDGRFVHRYRVGTQIPVDGEPVESLPVTDDVQADTLSPSLCFPERACRPIFELGPFGREYHPKTEPNSPLEGLIRIDVSQPSSAKIPSPPCQDSWWFDPKMGNVAVKTVSHPSASSVDRLKPVPNVEMEISFGDFKESPRGFWYPRIVNRSQSSRLYVDFTDIPSNEMFKAPSTTP